MENWHVLVIEDDPDGQEVVARILKHQGVTYDVAGTGEEALSLARRHAYTMAIVDLALPGLDGWGFLSAIQGDPAIAQMPCIAVTAFHSPDVAIKAIEMGFKAYFPKPIDATGFMRDLGHVVEKG